MDHHLRDYYRQSSDGSPTGSYHSVIALHLAPDITWEAISEKVPSLPRGWFELANLSIKDRIEFLRDFWLSKLPYTKGFDEFLAKFFGSLDDIGVFITQRKYDDPYEPHLIYSVRGDAGFFRGDPPLDEKGLLTLQKALPDVILPKDYLAFLQIHNGFCKTTDCSGVLQAELVPATYASLIAQMEQQPIITSRDAVVNPTSLIPFYKSFGMPYYQCFWSEWYPEQEMGNVYLSTSTGSISDIYSGESRPDTMAFATFIDWLSFYLEQIV